MRRRTLLSLLGSASLVGSTGCLELVTGSDTREHSFTAGEASADAVVDAPAAEAWPTSHYTARNALRASDATPPDGAPVTVRRLYDGRHPSPVTTDGERYYVTTPERDGRILALSPDGTVAWERAADVPGRHGVTLVGDRAVVAADQSPRKAQIRAYDRDTGDPDWSRDLYDDEDRGIYPGVDASFAVGETVYVASGRRILAIDAPSGERCFEFAAGDPVARIRSVTVDDGLVHVGARAGGKPPEGYVLALDPSEGEVAWELELDDMVDQVVAADGLAVVRCSGTLLGLDAESGDAEWTVSLSQEERGAGGPCAIGAETIVVPRTGGLTGRSLSDGTERWTTPLSDGTPGRPICVGDAALVPVIGDDGSDRGGGDDNAGGEDGDESNGGEDGDDAGDRLVAAALDDGRVQWQVSVPAPADTAIVSDGRAVLSTGDGVVELAPTE